MDGKSTLQGGECLPQRVWAAAVVLDPSMLSGGSGSPILHLRVYGLGLSASERLRSTAKAAARCALNGGGLL
jgi:hypothetical protein